MKQILFTNKAPRPLGPYSQGIKVGNLIFISGQIPIDPTTGAIAGVDIKTQTEQVIKNIEEILKSAGASLDNVVSVFVFLKDLSMLQDFNEAYEKFFKEKPPARTIVEVSDLPQGVLIEISAIAYV